MASTNKEVLVKSLSEGEWLDDSTIACFLYLYSHLNHKSKVPMVLAFDVLAMTNVVRKVDEGKKIPSTYGNYSMRACWSNIAIKHDKVCNIFTEDEQMLFERKTFWNIVVNHPGHWGLVIVCYAAKVLQPELFPEAVPCILYLDPGIVDDVFTRKFRYKSGTKNHETLEAEHNFSVYVYSLINLKFGRTNFFNTETMPLIECAVPQQTDCYSCGMFLLMYAWLFQANPVNNYELLRTGLRSTWFETEHVYELREAYLNFVTSGSSCLQQFKNLHGIKQG